MFKRLLGTFFGLFGGFFSRYFFLALILDEEKKRSSLRNDSNWNVFAELGVGLNPTIKTLTGNSLFDEKAYGTIHIAIGDNVG